MTRRFCSGSIDFGQPVQEQFGSVGDGQRDTQLVGEHRFHPLALAGPQQRGVHEHAFQAVADCPMD